MVDSPLRESLAALSQFFVGDRTVSETLRRVADLTIEAVPGADLVGLTMVVEGRQRTAVFTDELSPGIDQLSTTPVRALPRRLQAPAGLLRRVDPGRWALAGVPARRSRVRRGQHPVAAHGRRQAVVGAMNLDALEERAFEQQDVEVATLFSYQAAIVVANHGPGQEESDALLDELPRD